MPSTIGVDPSLSIIGFVAVLVIPGEIEFGKTLVSSSELHGYLGREMRILEACVQVSFFVHLPV
jgi:hypothetical protein